MSNLNLGKLGTVEIEMQAGLESISLEVSGVERLTKIICGSCVYPRQLYADPQGCVCSQVFPSPRLFHPLRQELPNLSVIRSDATDAPLYREWINPSLLSLQVGIYNLAVATMRRKSDLVTIQPHHGAMR